MAFEDSNLYVRLALAKPAQIAVIILPPKRFEDEQDPRFDPIRHKPWFSRLSKRRVKIKFLRAAHESWKKGGNSQTEASLIYGVDERELRDFSAFLDNKPLIHITKLGSFQSMLDDSYGHYCVDGARFHIRHYIEVIAPFYGIKPRHATEMWEVDPCYYPTNYKNRACPKCGDSSKFIRHSDGSWVCHNTHDL